MIAAELRQLHKLDFVSVTVDASKRNEQGRWRVGT